MKVDIPTIDDNNKNKLQKTINAFNTIIKHMKHQKNPLNRKYGDKSIETPSDRIKGIHSSFFGLMNQMQ